MFVHPPADEMCSTCGEELGLTPTCPECRQANWEDEKAVYDSSPKRKKRPDDERK